ncbi:MAG: DUF5398 family protein [Simkaniaceae bacterium]|nr:DUF5398 family protein [Simkaniaceae bacterium]
MFGLEKRKDKGNDPFKFDLEDDLKDKKKREEIKATVGSHMQDVKSSLKEGTAPEDFDKCGVLLHGYAALQKVIENVK